MTKKILLSLMLSFSLLPQVHAGESFFSWLFDFSRQKGVAPVTNENYSEECGACHFAYQPGLLPEQSWQKLFETKEMADHFGDNAEIDEALRIKLLEYVVENSADKSYYKRSKKLMASLNEEGKAVLRITETPYIKEKHEEIPDRLIRKNPEVKSLSQCNKCHKKAQSGIYDDDTVVIPGHGRW